MKKQTKKPNSFWLKNKQILCIALATTGLLLGLNYGVMAQNVSYNANSVPIGGNYSSAFGYEALKSNTGNWNTANGYQALYSNTTGIHNTANGYNALRSNTMGSFNTANGAHALYSNTTGSSNIANGDGALYANTTGSSNIANGDGALYANTTGNDNTANGGGALFANTTGYSNTANGINALLSNSTGSNNTALGYYANVASGNLSNATAIGANAKVNASNTIQLGDNAVTKVYAGVDKKATVVTGGLQVTGGSPSAGKVLTASDIFGVATWQTISNSSLADMPTATFKGRISSGTGAPEDLTVAQAKSLLNLSGTNTGDQTITLTGDVTGSGTGTFATTLKTVNGDIGTFNSLTVNEKGLVIAASNIANPDNEVPLFFSTGLTRNANTITNNLSTGIAGGQSVIGGTRASEALTLSSTKNATKGKILFGTSAYDELNNRLGIGNTTPTAKLDITGNVKIVDGTQAAGKVLTSDANGLASWQAPNTGADWSLTGNMNTTDGVHFIGTTNDRPFNIRVYNEKAGRIEFDPMKANTFYGYQSANSNTTGGANTVTGYQALYANTAGWYNTANGYAALYYTLGNHNTGTGYRALKHNAEGTGNTAMGSDALLTNNTGSFNTANGHQALYSNTTGGFNTANGYQALYANTTGDGNTAIGDRSLLDNTTGNYNTAIGSLTLSSNIDGKHNTAIGYAANVSTPKLENATVIGNAAIVNASNKIRLGNVAAKIVEIEMGGMYVVSDGRFKTNIKEEVKGLEFIQKLRPVVYNVDIRKRQEFLTQNMPADVRKEYMNKDFSASTAIRQSGFIAQEVEKAAQEVGYDFNGIHKPENANDNYSLAYSQFVVPLVKAVQELDKKDEQKDKQIEQLQKVNEQLQQRLEALEKMIAGGNNMNVPAIKTLPESAVEEVTLFPNPTTGMVTIKANHIDNGIMEIVDMHGNSIQRTIFNNIKTGYQFNVSNFTKGMYMVNIIANNKKYTQKLIVQ